MRNRGYVPNLKVPGSRKPSRLMKWTILLCALLPPVGLVLLWSRVRCPLRGKMLLSAVAVLCLIGMLVSGARLLQRPSAVSPPAAQTAPQAQQAQTFAPAEPIAPANPGI